MEEERGRKDGAESTRRGGFKHISQTRGLATKERGTRKKIVGMGKKERSKMEEKFERVTRTAENKRKSSLKGNCKNRNKKCNGLTLRMKVKND